MAYHKQPFISQRFSSHLLCTRCCAGGDGVQQVIRPLPASRVSHHCLHCSRGAPTSLHLPLALLPLSLGWEHPPRRPPPPMTRGDGSVTPEGCCGYCRRTPGLSRLSSCWHHQLHGHHLLPGLRGASVQPGTRGRPAEDRAEFCRACVVPVSDRSKSPDAGGGGLGHWGGGGRDPLEW